MTPKDKQILSIHVPMTFQKRGGRKQMIMPPGTPAQRQKDNTLVKALARAFRWQRMLDSGEYPTLAELAAREGIPASYLTRILRLTLLAPDLVVAILDGTQGPEVTLKQLLDPFPVEWRGQATWLRSLAD